MLIVLPTQAHVAQVLAARACGERRKVALGRFAVTLGELLRAVVDATLPGVRRLSALEERMILRRVALEQTGGGRFARVASRPGFVDALGATLGACRQAGVSADVLAWTAERTGGGTGRRLAAVAELIARFEALSDEVRAIDEGRAWLRAADALRDGAPLPAMLADAEGVVLRHIHELSPVRIELLDALAARIKPREVLVQLPHAAHAWFAATDRLLDRIEARGERLALACHPVDPFDGDGAGARIARTVTGAAATLGPGELSVVHAPGAEAEHRAIARMVRRLVDDGTPPERIAIAPRALEPHAAALAEALIERGVPVHARRGSAASSAPPVRWVRDALDAASRGWTRDAAARLLGSSYAAAILESHGLRGPQVVQMLRQVGVRADPSGGSEPVSDALARLAGGADEADASRVRRALEMIRTLAAPAAEATDVASFVEAVRALIDGASLRAILQRGARARAQEVLLEDRFARGGAAVAVQSVEAIGRDEAALDALEGALDELASAARCAGLDGPLSPGLLLRLLEDALAGRTLPAGGAAGGAVRIIALRDAAGLDLDVLVVPGLREGEIPAPPGIDPLLGPAERSAAARALAERAGRFAWTFDVDGPGGAASTEREPLLLALALASAGTDVLLTRSRTDAQARPVPASPLLEDVLASCRAAGAPFEETHAPIEPAPPTAEAYGLEDVRRAALASLAAVAPGTPAERAAEEDLLARVAAGDDPPAVRLRDLLEVAAIERSRIAVMLGGQDAPGDRFAGYLGDDPLALSLLAERAAGTAAAPFSASQLERAARCPFQDFAARVLGVRADDEAQDDVDPRRRGDLAHRCFEAAMGALIEADIQPYRESRADEAAALAREHAAVAATAWREASGLDPELARVVAEQIVDQTVSLVRALYASDDGFAPIAVEHAFDSGVRDAAWPALAVPDPGGGDPIRVRGRLDLVERRGDAIRVSDLKTGGKQRVEAMLSPDALGISALQLPLYAAAARASVSGVRRADARYLVLREACATDTLREAMEAKAWRDDERAETDVVDVVDAAGRPTALAARVHRLVARMRAGDHRALPAADACKTCSYLALCRLPIGAPAREDT